MNTEAVNPARPNNEADLICEALVKEIGRGGRWCAVVEAWQALLTVRRMSKDMEVERTYLSGAGMASSAGDLRSMSGTARG